MQNSANAFLAFFLVILSLGFSTVLFEFFRKITELGIEDVEHDRKGSEASQTAKWIDRIRNSSEIIIIGTSSRGWFVEGADEFYDFLKDELTHKQQLKIYLLDPFGEIWRHRIASGFVLKDFIRQYSTAFANLIKILKLNNENIQLHVYDTSPISCVISDKIYLGIYLPYSSRKTSPELTIERNSRIGTSIYIKRLFNVSSGLII